MHVWAPRVVVRSPGRLQCVPRASTDRLHKSSLVALQTPPIFNDKKTQIDEKSENGGGRGKKERNFGRVQRREGRSGRGRRVRGSTQQTHTADTAHTQQTQQTHTHSTHHSRHTHTADSHTQQTHTHSRHTQNTHKIDDLGQLAKVELA